MDVSLRPERPEDDEFLFTLYASTRAAEMELAPWSKPQKEAFLRSQFELQRTHYRRYYPDARFDLIEDGGRPVGRLYVYRTPAEIRLMDIALIAAYRNRGLGGALVRELVSEAEMTGRPITLHVEADNRAHRLYARLGFREIGRNGPYVLMERWPGSDAPETPAESHRRQAGA